MLAAQQGCDCQWGLTSVPPGGNGPFPVVPRTGRLVLPAPSRERLSCSQMVMSRGFTPPTTPGPRVPGSPSRIPFPKRPTKGWLIERCRVLPQRPGSHSVPSSPDEDIIRGSVRNLCTRRLEDQTTGASRWTHEDVHLHPQGNASRPKPGSSNPMFNRHKPPTA